VSKIILFNADDWGLSQRIHDSITSLADQNAIDAAGIMMGQRFTAKAVEYAKSNPDLRAGIHLFANDPDCHPLTRQSWPRIWPPGLMLPISLGFPAFHDLILAEADAQLAAWKDTDLPLSFVNSHMGYHSSKQHLHDFVSLIKKHFPDFNGWIRLGDVKFFEGSVMQRGDLALDLIEKGIFARSWEGRSNETIWGTDSVFKNNASQIVKAVKSLGPGFHEFYFHPGRNKSLADNGTDQQALLDLAIQLPQAARNVSQLPKSN
jgi:hypothetical protein